MQEKWTFDCPYSISSKPSSLRSFLETKENELEIFLSFYFKKEGAVVENIFLSSEPFYKNQNSGSLLFEFDVVYFNACLSINEKEKEKMKIDFTLDQQKGQIHLKGPFWQEREMDEI